MKQSIWLTLVMPAHAIKNCRESVATTQDKVLFVWHRLVLDHPVVCGGKLLEGLMRILYVDDNAMNRLVVRDMLKVGGAEMSEASNAEAGHRMIDTTNFDIVLMDLRMPGTDGLTAIKQIRTRTDSKASVPIVVITADTRPGLRGVCLESGADDLLLKPVMMEELFDIIGRVVAARS